MATKVGLENNILKIEQTDYTLYYNAAWCSVYFYPIGTSDSVIIMENGSRLTEDKSVTIAFTDFQDLGGTPYNTEATIATYLSDKIG